MGRIGVYGGTFNPPHLGHIQAACYALSVLKLDRLLMIPAYIAPHKILPQDSATPAQRLEMLRRATTGSERLEVSSIELDRGGTSYTFETIEQLKRQYPQDELVLFMGTDMFLTFHNWREPERIIENASIGVFYRGDRDEKEKIAQQKILLEDMGAIVYLVDNPITQISSTDLRRMLVFGCAGPYLSIGIQGYVEREGLYGAGKDLRNLPLDQLEEQVISLVKPSRVAHIRGCRDTAVKLARHWGADENAAARAGLLHDITKALDGPYQLTLCNLYGIMLDKFSAANPKTLHALTGSFVAERIFGESPEVVQAVRWHTTGKADMNTLEKIIYVADYMEPNRDFSGVEELRSLAYTDLDKALKLGLTMTLKLLQEQGREISPESQQAWTYLEKTGV